MPKDGESDHSIIEMLNEWWVIWSAKEKSDYLKLMTESLDQGNNLQPEITLQWLSEHRDEIIESFPETAIWLEQHQ